MPLSMAFRICFSVHLLIALFRANHTIRVYAQSNDEDQLLPIEVSGIHGGGTPGTVSVFLSLFFCELWCVYYSLVNITLFQGNGVHFAMFGAE